MRAARSLVIVRTLGRIFLGFVVVIIVVDFVVVIKVVVLVDCVVVEVCVVVVVDRIVMGLFVVDVVVVVIVVVVLIVFLVAVVPIVVNVALKVVVGFNVDIDVFGLLAEVVVISGWVVDLSSHSKNSFSSPSLSRQNTLLVTGSWSLSSPRHWSLVTWPRPLLASRDPCLEVITLSHARSSLP